MASVASEDGEQIALNVMPMLDIFSILILFLLMSFSTDPVSHDISDGIELPESFSLRSLDEVPTLSASDEAISVNGRAIAAVKNRKVVGRYLSQGGIEPLYQELSKLAKSNKKFSKDRQQTGTLTVEVDRAHPYLLVKQIMVSAQQADFVTFKLMVAKSSAE